MIRAPDRALIFLQRNYMTHLTQEIGFTRRYAILQGFYSDYGVPFSGKKGHPYHLRGRGYHLKGPMYHLKDPTLTLLERKSEQKGPTLPLLVRKSELKGPTLTLLEGNRSKKPRR